MGSLAVIGEGCQIDESVIFTGACWIGNNVSIRPGAIISRGTVIEDWVFIGPGVITNHTKHVDWGRDARARQYVTYIGFGSILGSGTVVVAGCNLGHHSIVGAGSVVTKDLEGEGLYLGNPARFMRELKPEEYVNKPHENAMYRKGEIYRYLKSHMPNLASWNGTDNPS